MALTVVPVSPSVKVLPSFGLPAAPASTLVPNRCTAVALLLPVVSTQVPMVCPVPLGHVGLAMVPVDCMVMVLAVMAVVLVGVMTMMLDSEVATVVDSRLVMIVRPLAAPRVLHGRVRHATMMMMMTALEAAVRTVPVVMVGIAMVVMDSAVVVVAACAVLLMVQVVLLRVQSLGIFLLGYLQAL